MIVRAFCLLVELITRRRGYFSLQIGLACRCCLGLSTDSIAVWFLCPVVSAVLQEGRNGSFRSSTTVRLPKARLNLTVAVLYSATPDERPLTLALDYHCFNQFMCVVCIWSPNPPSFFFFFLREQEGEFHCK